MSAFVSSFAQTQLIYLNTTDSDNSISLTGIHLGNRLGESDVWKTNLNRGELCPSPAPETCVMEIEKCKSQMRVGRMFPSCPEICLFLYFSIYRSIWMCRLITFNFSFACYRCLPRCSQGNLDRRSWKPESYALDIKASSHKEVFLHNGESSW